MLWSISPTMDREEDGILVVFHLPEGTDKAQHRIFRRRIYGEETSSWKGRYQYHRTGILDKIPHVRLYWGIVIVQESDARALIQIIKDNGGIIDTRIIRLRPSDRRTLMKRLSS
jgi:hypothetical protein